MKKIKIIRSRPLKEEEEVIDQQPQDVAPKPPAITFESNPLEFILQKYPTLTKTLVDLLTEDFRDYITGVYIMAPKPTTFKIVLHNNRYFHLMFMGDDKYEAKVSGKKYWLSKINELELATMSIAELLMLGTPPSTEGPSEELPAAEEETPAETPEETPTETPAEEETPELKESVKRFKIVEAKDEETSVSGQDAEILGVALWNASLKGKLPKELSQYKKVFEALKNYSSKYKTEISKFSGRRESTTDFWAEETGKSSDEPKTDLISTDEKKLRLSAKKGPAQLMSAAPQEAKATVLAAARTSGLDGETKTKLMKLISELAGATKTEKLNTGDLKKMDVKQIKSKVNIKAKQVIETATKAQTKLQDELRELFNTNPKFKTSFAYEAMTGQQKFGNGSPAEANFVIAFNNSFTDVKLEDISKISSPMVKKIADKCNVSVSFKSSSYKIKGEKAGYNFFSAVRVSLEDLVAKEEKLKEVLDSKEINEGVWDKIKEFLSYLYDKFNKVVDYISEGIEKLKELIKEGIDKVLEFLGIDIDVKFNNNIDFYSA